MKRVIADRVYDCIRTATTPVLRGHRNRKRPIQYDEHRYKDCWRVKAMFCRLKHLRGIATRCDKCPEHYLAAVKLICVCIWCAAQ